jgi:cobyrinic acid a,c-diamide synthase
VVEVPRIVVAGTHSGVGKTTIASGLMAALRAKSHEVAPFKVALTL